MTLEPVTIDGDKVTCGSQSVEIWLSGIALYYADNWGESPGEVTFEEAEELIEALKVAVVEGRRMEAEREKQNAIDEVDPTRELRVLIRDGDYEDEYPTLLTQEWNDGHDFDEPFVWATQHCDCQPFGDVGV